MPSLNDDIFVFFGGTQPTVSINDAVKKYTEAALPGASFATALSQQYAIPNAAETMVRPLVTSQALAIASGDVRLTYFQAANSFTSTQVKTYTGNTAAAATPTLCRVGLYAVDASGNLTLIASTPNTTTLWAAANTEYVTAWSANVAIVSGQRYALGHCIVTAVATPTFVGPSMIGLPTGLAAASPTLSAAVTGQADLPASVAVGSLAGSVRLFYSAIV